jgi:hypothetical protein
MRHNDRPQAISAHRRQHPGGTASRKLFFVSLRLSAFFLALTTFFFGNGFRLANAFA